MSSSIRPGSDKLAKPTEDEEDMLDLAFGLEKTSRLGCQIVMSEALDGLVVKLPSADAGTRPDNENRRRHVRRASTARWWPG